MPVFVNTNPFWTLLNQPISKEIYIYDETETHCNNDRENKSKKGKGITIQFKITTYDKKISHSNNKCVQSA